MSECLTRLDSIPEELRTLPQWIVCDKKGKPFQVTGEIANHQEPKTWTTFQEASACAETNGLYVAFVLTTSDPYVLIDLDVKDATATRGPIGQTPEEQQRYRNIIDAFGSYTEQSSGGRGWHVVVRTDDPLLSAVAVRRQGVEVYGRDHNIKFTGNGGGAIVQDDVILAALVADCGGGEAAAFVAEDAPAREDDEAVLDRARAAKNADVFNALWTGDWHGVGYDSQSSADHALMRMLAFWSPNDEQCVRLFRMSALGQRKKAERDKYLAKSLRKHRIAMAIEAQGAASAEAISATLKDSEHTPLPTVALDWPPGRAGELARWLYAISPRPLKEVAILTTLGILAGSYGRCVNVNGSGLNLYLALVARSGVGKEAMHSGPSRILSEVLGGTSHCEDAIDFTEYASGPGLIKGVGPKLCTINISGEFGRNLAKMAIDMGPAQTLRTALTHLYQKSGYEDVAGGMGYSDKDKNTDKVRGLSYSMMGETTPDTFYQSLTESMLADGFLSRFIVIECQADRPPLNMSRDVPAPYWLKTALTVAMNACHAVGPGSPPVEPTYEHGAFEKLDVWGRLSDALVNAEENEGKRQAYSRSHLKMLKISALLGAIDSGEGFCAVSNAHVDWAMNIVKRDMNTMLAKLDGGDIGTSDDARLKKLRSLFREYATRRTLRGSEKKLQQAGLVPRSWLQSRAGRIPAFVGHRAGIAAALDLALKTMLDDGELIEISKMTVAEEHNLTGRVFKFIGTA